ncbi:MAG: pyrroline-5-carboxylate reductase [Bdellovibrionales bacterium]
MSPRLPRLLLVGAGKMGGAMLQKLAGQVSACVVDPAPPPAHLKSLKGVTWLTGPDKIDFHFAPDIVVIAIKPQQMASVLPAYMHFQDAVFLSIAAGQTLARLEGMLGGCAIIRAMPNLPASIGQGAAVAVANKKVADAQRALADKILGAIGTVAWMANEKLMDAVTALSGSGPAYVFALVETMAKAGEALGLPKDLATRLARQTIIGSGALLAQSAESAENLRKAVTSPGGTTEAALEELLDESGLPDLMLRTMEAAARRSKELS